MKRRPREIALALSALAATATFAVGEAARRGPSWLTPAETESFLVLGAIDLPSRDGWEITARDATTVTFASGACGSAFGYATYDLATRRDVRSEDAYATEWVNAADVAAGEAVLGTEQAVLVDGNAAYHEFHTASSVYRFDAETGRLLVHERSDTGVLRAAEPGDSAC